MIHRSEHNLNSHLTVKDRQSPSLPLKVLLERNKIVGEVLDFGCGLGRDVKHLQEIGYNTTAYDPYYQPEYPLGKFDTIICFYVLNVLLPEEQTHVLMAISELLKPEGKAFFAVRRDIKKSGFRFNPKKRVESYQCNVRLPYESIFQTAHCEIYQYQHYTNLHDGDSSVSPWLAGLRKNLITESATVFAISKSNKKGSADQFLVIPKRKVTDYFELTERQQQACWMVANRIHKTLNKGKETRNLEIRVRKDDNYPHCAIELIPFPPSGKRTLTLEERRKKHPNAYAPWTEEKDNELEVLYCEGKTTKELTTIFGRNSGAIRSRIKKLQLKEKYNR